MELRHLRYFVAVAETLHFGKAAARLNVAQPSLSQQIKQLEQELEVLLFIRTKRHVELTEAGKAFLEQIYLILTKLEIACNDARKIHQGEQGSLVIAYAGSMHKTLLQLLLNYRKKFPNVEVELYEMSTTAQVQALHEGKIHIGVLSPPIESTSLNLQTIIQVPFVVALPLSHPLAAESTPLDVGKLEKEPFILPPRHSGPGYYDTIISMCHQAGFSPKIIQEAHGLSTVTALVAAEMGIAIITKLALQHASHGVLFKELNSDTTIKTSLAWRKEEKSPVVNTFLTLAKDFLHDKNMNELFS